MHPQDPSPQSDPQTTITISTTDPVDPSATSPPGARARALYFAYGSNLSFTQMRYRCTQNPSLSSHPVAIARLDRWRWLICQPGYANVVPPPELRIGPQATDGAAVPISGADDAVFGVLYEMDPADERLLDGYEGVDHAAGPATPHGGPVPVAVRPREQGDGDYNKWYVPATVVHWLDEGQRARWEDRSAGVSTVPVLVYVDELRVRLAPPKAEYVPRMNRAIREAESIGFPEKWAEEVMRPAIPLEN
ncbi:hypothetical protein BDV59DRAFT_197713 [Aspergillus ambiguus]|uniref:gamma-glutamylcyclotransferase family protein n=1 Tax=Aspergillus ambiguus TaxID=176160 RepID=UPI003CCD5AA3